MEELEKSMYYGASQITFDKARRLRSRETEAELALWNRIKGKQIRGLRFRRQHPIENYIVDFYCHKARLIIEIDGKVHLKRKEADHLRTLEFEKYEIKVIRFTNEEVLNNIEMVIDKISETVKYRL